MTLCEFSFKCTCVCGMSMHSLVNDHCIRTLRTTWQRLDFIYFVYIYVLSLQYIFFFLKIRFRYSDISMHLAVATIKKNICTIYTHTHKQNNCNFKYLFVSFYGFIIHVSLCILKIETSKNKVTRYFA